MTCGTRIHLQVDGVRTESHCRAQVGVREPPAVSILGPGPERGREWKPEEPELLPHAAGQCASVTLMLLRALFEISRLGDSVLFLQLLHHASTLTSSILKKYKTKTTIFGTLQVWSLCPLTRKQRSAGAGLLRGRRGATIQTLEITSESNPISAQSGAEREGDTQSWLRPCTRGCGAF